MRKTSADKRPHRRSSHLSHSRSSHLSHSRSSHLPHGRSLFRSPQRLQLTCVNEQH
jgi:hypothetical protein